MPDTLAYGAFHTLLAIRQCGADTKRVIHIVAIVVNVAVIAVDERRIVIVVARRAQPPAALQPCPCHKETHTDFCYNHRFSISILCIICCFILAVVVSLIDSEPSADVQALYAKATDNSVDD